MSSVGIESTPTTTSLDHDCPYERFANKSYKVLGERGVAAALFIAQIESTITSLHADGECPPTHVGTGPTTEWADFLSSASV